MVDYDFVEIGSNDSDTFACWATPETVGLIVEPSPLIASEMANIKHCRCMVAEADGDMELYFVTPAQLRRIGAPESFAALSTLQVPHRSIIDWLQSHGVEPKSIISNRRVPCKSMATLVREYRIRRVKLFKIDAVAQNSAILRAFFAAAEDAPDRLPQELLVSKEPGETKLDDATEEEIVSRGYVAVANFDKRFVRLQKRRVVPTDLEHFSTGSRFFLDMDWYSKPRQTGVSFMVRARNEEKTIQTCLTSIIDRCSGAFDFEIILVLNQCTDQTESLAKQILAPHKHLRWSIHYYPFQLAKPGLEMFVTGALSLHSMVFFSQWAMMKCNHKWIFRWDADFYMTPDLATSVRQGIARPDVSALNIDAVDEDGVHNQERYMFRTDMKPYYCKFRFWEVQKFKGEDNIRHGSIPKAVASIQHCSSLKRVKNYYSLDPWWTGTRFHAKYQTPYENMLAQLPVGAISFCRASDPACEPMINTLPHLVEDLPLSL